MTQGGALTFNDCYEVKPWPDRVSDEHDHDSESEEIEVRLVLGWEVRGFDERVEDVPHFGEFEQNGESEVVVLGEEPQEKGGEHESVDPEVGNEIVSDDEFLGLFELSFDEFGSIHGENDLENHDDDWGLKNFVDVCAMRVEVRFSFVAEVEDDKEDVEENVNHQHCIKKNLECII